jgi:hypothetical protein
MLADILVAVALLGTGSALWVVAVSLVSDR